MHDRLVRQPARHRVVVALERPRRWPRRARRQRRQRAAARTSRRPSSSSSATSRSCSARCRKRPRARSARCPSKVPKCCRAWLPFLEPLRQAAARGRPPHRLGPARRWQSRPEVAANTVVLFTSDHGEYGGSHGLRGKGAGAYEEAIRVPLLVKDNRGLLTQSPERCARQLTSSVDIAPLLLSDRERLERLARGSALRAPRRTRRPGWRCSPTRTRRDGRTCCTRPTRSSPSSRSEPYAADAPRHVIALRTPRGEVRDLLRLGAGQHRAARPPTQERELYDYGADSGRLELHNSTGESALEDPLSATLEGAIADELRRPAAGLPRRRSSERLAGLLRSRARRREQRRRRARTARRKSLRRARRSGHGRSAALGTGRA